MRSISVSELVEELQEELQAQITRAREVCLMDPSLLQTRPAPDRWSVVEVFRHMVLSSGHYHDRLKEVYSGQHPRLHRSDRFMPGRIGQLSVDAMRPKVDGRIGWKMRTLSRFEPRPEGVVKHDGIEGFIRLCEGFHHLLSEAKVRGMDGPRVVSTLGPIIRFRVGDAFRFPIAHQQRHMLQVERTLAQVAGKGR